MAFLLVFAFGILELGSGVQGICLEQEGIGKVLVRLTGKLADFPENNTRVKKIVLNWKGFKVVSKETCLKFFEVQEKLQLFNVSVVFTEKDEVLIESIEDISAEIVNQSATMTGIDQMTPLNTFDLRLLMQADAILTLNLNFYSQRKLSSSCADDLCVSCELISCKSTYPGYYLDSLKSIKSCSWGCRNCESDSKCTECASGFFLNSTFCSPCPGNCLNCVNETHCQVCDYGYFIEKNLCNPCLSGCSICKNASNCGKCDSGFQLTSNGSCFKCPQGCQSCSDKCLTALPGFFLADSVLPCSANCLGCDSLDTCKACLEGFYIDSNMICQPCPSHCKSCRNGESCEECEFGYYLTPTKVCLKCKNNCDYCQVESICDRCQTGYYFDQKQSLCLQCPDGCGDCQGNTCLACIPLGYKNESSVCKACPNGAALCSQNSSCFEGFYFQDNECVSCGQCKSCYKGKCTSCFEGFYLNVSCLQCRHGCQVCSADTCSVCLTGFFLYNNECFVCPAGCFACNNENNCSICNPGFYLNGNTCKKCSEFSNQCKTDSVPVRCESNYYLNKSTCLPCIENCQWCNFSTCFSCIEGSYQEKDSCNKCPVAFCSSCTKSSCLSCDSGHFLNQNQSCSACPSFCLSCSNSSSCLLCDSGYRLTPSSQCESCPDNCAQCSSFQCIKCKSGFIQSLSGDCKACTDARCFCLDGFFNNGKTQCEACPFNCSTCWNSTSCSSCRAGFSLTSQGSCSRCTQLHCSDCPEDKCRSCLSGFFLKNSQCFPCSQYCSACLSPSHCLECSVGFELFKERFCIPCPAFCAHCSGGICNSCVQGYKMTGGECKSLVSNCLIYENSVCSYCSGRFSVLNGICADCAGVSVLSADFDEYFKKLSFKFNRNIEKPETRTCSECKNILSTYSDIGNDCICYGYGNIFELQFKTWYSVTLSSAFVVKTEKLFTYICESNELTIGVTPSYTAMPSPPSATIIGSVHKSLNCKDEFLYYDIGEVVNSYGFDLNLTWFASTTPTNSIIESLVLASKESYLKIPLSSFENQDSEIFIEVIVQNMVQLTGKSNFTSFLYKAMVLQTEIDSPAYKEIEYTKDYIVSGRVTDFCMQENANMRWTFVHKDSELFNGGYPHLLYIPAFVLSPLKSYFFNFTAYSGALVGFSELEVYVKYSPLNLVLDLTNCSVSKDYDLTISAALSSNPNNKEDKSFYYLWEYCEWKDSECEDNPDTFDSGNTFQMAKEDLPPNGTVWKFIVTMSSSMADIPSVSQEFFLEFISGLSSSIKIKPYSSRLELLNKRAVFSTNISNFNDSVNLTLKWEFSELTSSKFEIMGLSLPSLNMMKKSADLVYEYVLTLKVIEEGHFSYAQFFLRVNQGAVCTSAGLRASPSSKITEFKTLVDLSITACSDIDNDYPLLYRFSVKICSKNCTMIYSGADPNKYTPYFQVSVKKEFSYVTCKMPAGVLKASVQVCDQLGGCNSYKQNLEVKKNSDLGSVNVIKEYYSDIDNPDLIPYYSIIYMTMFELNKEEFNNIYQNFLGYLKKMKITNLDVVHILLTFINEMFKSGNQFLNEQLIVKFLNDAISIISRHSDDITDQNVEVTSEIIFNVVNSGINIESNPTLINIAMNFAAYVFKEYAVGRLPGDLIVNYTTNESGKNNFRYFKYRNTVRNITDEIDGRIDSLIKYIRNVKQDPDVIINVDVCSIELKNGQGLILVQMSKSGIYNETNFYLVSTPESFIGINSKSVYLYVKNQYSDQVCVYFNSKSWIDSLCQIDKFDSENSVSGIIVSSSSIYKIDDKNSYYYEEPVTYGPVILAGVMTAAAIFAYIGFYYYERATLKEPYKKRNKNFDVNLESTCSLIIKHTLMLSFFSKDPEVSKKLNLLKLLVLLNVQMTIDGLFIGFGVINDEKWSVIVGTGFIVTLLTIPYNIFYLVRIDRDKKCWYLGFIYAWFFQLVATLSFILIINIYKTKGKNSSWILAFAIGLACEFVVESIIMVVYNIRISNAQAPSNKV